MWRGGDGRIPSRETAEQSRPNPRENFIVPNEVSSSFPPHSFMDSPRIVIVQRRLYVQ